MDPPHLSFRAQRGICFLNLQKQILRRSTPSKVVAIWVARTSFFGPRLVDAKPQTQVRGLRYPTYPTFGPPIAMEPPHLSFRAQ
jgi:hypothetical protein